MCYTQYELSNKNDTNSNNEISCKSNTTLITNQNNIDYKSKYNIINNKL